MRRATVGRTIAAGLVALLPLARADAQTSPRGVPADRPDQNVAAAPPRGAPTPPAPAEARDAAAPIAPFVLTGVTVDGSTLPVARIAAAWQPFVGRTIDNAGLSAITTAVADAYAASDIALYTVLVPEQSFGGGTLRLVAVEGYVAGVEVRGKLRRNRVRLLQAYLRRLERERPLHTSTLQRMISLIRDMPGVTVDPSFERGDAQGAVRLVMTASEKPVQFAIGVNDRGTALLGRTQVQSDALFNGVVAGGDQLRATVVAPTRVSRFQYYAGAYTAPLDADGTSVTANLSYLRTRPRAFPLKGKATSFGLQLSRAIVRGYDRNLYATLGVDGIDTDNALLGQTLSNDRVRALRAALSYTVSGKRNQLTLSATGSFGLDVLGARVVPGQSDPRFRKLNAKANDALQVGKSFVLRLSAFGQLTGDDLPSSEQVALGGDEYGRAYEAAIIAGDTGYAGSAEIAWLPQSGLPPLLAGSELYLFSDGGSVRYRGRFGLPASDSHLGSIGGGVRVHVAARTILQLEAARGLSSPVFYEDNEKTRLLFSVRSVL